MVSLPLLVYEFAVEEDHTEMAIYLTAGLFLLLTLPIFLVGLMQHIFNYTQPHLQKHIIRYVVWVSRGELSCYYVFFLLISLVRILWIVPIYSLNSVSCDIVCFEML